jgi:sensor histidine kinase regulating citrate/malate metabolism
MISVEAIINSLKETIILFDKNTKITYINKSGEEFRKSSKDIIGKNSYIFTGEKPFLLYKTILEGRSFRGNPSA